MRTITKVKDLFLMDGDVHTAEISYGFTGLIIELEDGRIFTHATTDPMQQFGEMKSSHKYYEQIKALIKSEEKDSKQLADKNEL